MRHHDAFNATMYIEKTSYSFLHNYILGSGFTTELLDNMLDGVLKDSFYGANNARVLEQLHAAVILAL